MPRRVRSALADPVDATIEEHATLGSITRDYVERVKGGDVGSLGRHVTAAVVHAIFSIILIDAVFALVYMELKL